MMEVKWRFIEHKYKSAKCVIVCRLFDWDGKVFHFYVYIILFELLYSFVCVYIILRTRRKNFLILFYLLVFLLYSFSSTFSGCFDIINFFGLWYFLFRSRLNKVYHGRYTININTSIQWISHLIYTNKFMFKRNTIRTYFFSLTSEPSSPEVSDRKHATKYIISLQKYILLVMCQQQQQQQKTSVTFFLTRYRYPTHL